MTSLLRNEEHIITQHNLPQRDISQSETIVLSENTVEGCEQHAIVVYNPEVMLQHKVNQAT